MRRKDAYSPAEDAIILSSRSPRTAFKRLRGRRTLAAVVQRKWMLRNPEPPPTIVQTRRGERFWTEEEEALLKREWPLAKSTKDIVLQLRRYTPSQIRSKAAHLGLKRWFNGSDIALEGHKELIDQIRIRSKQDGIPLIKLDKIVGSNRYFGHCNWKNNKRINFVFVARAIEFFGGTLVIDWCDR